MKRSKSSANSRLGQVLHGLATAPPWLRRSRPSLSAARPGPLGRSAGLAAARRDGPCLSWSEGREARQTVVAVVDNAGTSLGADRGDADG